MKERKRKKNTLFPCNRVHVSAENQRTRGSELEGKQQQCRVSCAAAPSPPHLRPISAPSPPASSPRLLLPLTPAPAALSCTLSCALSCSVSDIIEYVQYSECVPTTHVIGMLLQACSFNKCPSTNVFNACPLRYVPALVLVVWHMHVVPWGHAAPWFHGYAARSSSGDMSATASGVSSPCNTFSRTPAFSPPFNAKTTVRHAAW